MSIRNLDALLRPQRLVLLGEARSPGQQQIQRNVADTVAQEQRWLIGAEARGWATLPALDRAQRVDLAVGFDGRLLHAEALGQLAAQGVRALVWATDVPVDAARLAAARAGGLRILGARTPGFANLRAGLNVSAFPTPVKAGRLAFVAQSRTLAAAALDWAAGRGIGFSWLAVTGAEADIDVATLLDYAALDPQTEAVVVQLSHIGHARHFMSAARALARVKPVAILQTRAADAIESGHGFGPDPVRSAAFRRAGLVECDTLGSLFDAIAALERLPKQAEPRVAVVGNGAGVVGLGVDALLRHGLPLVRFEPEFARAVPQRWPLARVLEGAVDLGSAPAVEVVRLVTDLLASGTVDLVLLVYSPGPGEAHEAVVEALIAAGVGARVLTVWLGLATAQPARRRCAEAGIPTFAAAGDAARALVYRRLHHQTQELLTQTPPATERLSTDRSGVAAQILAAEPGEDGRLHGPRVLDWLAAYGVGKPRGGFWASVLSGRGIVATLRRHPELGTHLSVRADLPGLRLPEARAFPPLDGLLARRLLEDAGFVWHEAGAARDAQRLALALIRLGQFAIEQPHAAEVSLRIVAAAGSSRCTIDDASLLVDRRPPPEPARLALPPYPSELEQDAPLRDGRRLRVRAIRPEDEPELIRMLEQTDPEAIRLRFFSAIRYFSHAMAARFSQIDYDRELVLVAVRPRGSGEARVYGIAHLSIDPDERRAEYAILVHQDMARQGLGRHMLLRLLDYAAGRGIGLVYGEVLADNAGMLALCAQLGFRARRADDDPGCIHVEIDPALAIR